MIILKIVMTISQNYYSQTLIFECMKLKLKKFIKNLALIKKIFDFSNYSTESKYCDNSNKLAIGKMKDESGGVAEEFVGLKPKIYSFLVGNSEHEKVKSFNRNVVETISYNEYREVLLKNKCIRHSMNRIQSKDHRIACCLVLMAKYIFKSMDMVD